MPPSTEVSEAGVAEVVSDAEKGEILLEIARESVRHAVLGTPETERDDAWLWRPGATFVTLRARGALRGCLGSLEARLPLIQDLRSNARAVTSRDPRFPPLTADELSETSVEVSLLSPLEPVACGSEEDAVDRLARGRDGWVLTWRDHTGTFLPQVWESLPEPRDFLCRLKEKAGLAADFWHPEIRLWRYSVAKWAEAD